jgi:hypothetical protein
MKLVLARAELDDAKSAVVYFTVPIFEKEIKSLHSHEGLLALGKCLAQTHRFILATVEKYNPDKVFVDDVETSVVMKDGTVPSLQICCMMEFEGASAINWGFHNLSGVEGLKYIVADTHPD